MIDITPILHEIELLIWNDLSKGSVFIFVWHSVEGGERGLLLSLFCSDSLQGKG